MSFAPKKSMDRRSSPDSQKKSSTNLHESPFNVQQRSRSTLDPEATNRVDILEAHLSRISTQQDALLPLMNMLDLAPNVAKNENLLKNLSKKSMETDEKITKLEDMIKGYQGNIDSAIQKINSMPKPQQFDAGLFERNLKLLNGQVIDHQNALKDTQANMDNFHKAFDARIDDEADHNLKIMETKLEKQKNEFSHAITELKLTINDTLRKLDDALRELYEKGDRYEEFMAINDRQKIMSEFQEVINARFQQQFEFFREKYDRDLENLFREFGIVRSEMDLIYDERRQKKLQPVMQSFAKDTDPAERKIKINNTEQALNILELEQFNGDNTQRLMYELQGFDDKLEMIKNKYLSAKAKMKQGDKNIELSEDMNKVKEDLDILREKHNAVKNQMEGAKKKYFFDMRRIEDKMERLTQIKKQVQDELESNKKLAKTAVPNELQVLDSFPDKIKNLMDSINVNLDTTFTRFDMVEEKLKETQELVRAKKK